MIINSVSGSGLRAVRGSDLDTEPAISPLDGGGQSAPERRRAGANPRAIGPRSGTCLATRVADRLETAR